MIKTSSSRQNRMTKRWLWMMLAFLVVGLMGAQDNIPAGPSGSAHGSAWEPFSFWTSSQYSGFEKYALLANVVIALAGLGYALMLGNEVYGAGTGTSRMEESARAGREAADHALKRPPTTVAIPDGPVRRD